MFKDSVCKKECFVHHKCDIKIEKFYALRVIKLLRWEMGRQKNLLRQKYANLLHGSMASSWEAKIVRRLIMKSSTFYEIGMFIIMFTKSPPFDPNLSQLNPVTQFHKLDKLPKPVN
jgi:hypothetical protein